MEWLDKLTEQAKGLFIAPAPVVPLPPPLPTRHIGWEEVYELDPALDKQPKRKQAYVAELKRWESTYAGQHMFATYIEAKSRIPDGYKFVDPDKHDKSASDILYHAMQSNILKDRTDPKRIFLYCIPEDEGQWSFFDKFGAQGYSPTLHYIQINKTILNWPSQLLPKEIDGKKSEAPATVLEILQHETQHAVDHLNSLFAATIPGIVKPRTNECEETRAVAAENTLLKELHQPLRYAYNDPIYALQHTYAKGATLSPEQYRDLKEQLYDDLSIDTVKCDREDFTGEGAKLSRVDAIKKISDAVNHMLTDYGIRPSHTPTSTAGEKTIKR